MPLLLLLTFIFCHRCFSQVEIMKLDFDLGARHVHNLDTQRERIQGRVRVGFTVDADGLFELIGVASTGENFDSSWASVSDSTSKVSTPTLAFRTLYLRKIVGGTQLEAGAMTTEATVGEGGLPPGGWLDGIRVKTQTRIGQIKVVAGSLGSFDEPNMLKRKFRGNFVELELEKELFEDLLAQVGIQSYNNETYLRNRFEAKLKIFGSKVLKLVSDGLYDLERGALSYDVGAELDLLKLLFDKFDGRLEVQIYHSKLDERMPERAGTISAFHTYGERWSLHLAGRLDKKGRLNWYHRRSMGKTDRHDTGITLKIPIK
jgi:hypothetical protein